MTDTTTEGTLASAIAALEAQERAHDHFELCDYCQNAEPCETFANLQGEANVLRWTVLNRISTQAAHER